uniref:RNA-binding protein 34 n=1 Tax=Aceria tosichella TaxID=561515 RepID=A0A6G1SQA8_9ACAR
MVKPDIRKNKRKLAEATRNSNKKPLDEEEEDEEISLSEEDSFGEDLLPAAEQADDDDDDEEDDDEDDDEEDDDEDDEGEENVEDDKGEKDGDEDEADEDEAEKDSKQDSKPVQDITTVALERTIFVGNLPTNLDHRDVVKMFKSCGPVESARIRSVVPEKEKLSPKVALITGRIHQKVNSVNAYVVFAKTDDTDECIKKALAKNGEVIDGHHIRVDRAQQANAKRMTLASRKKSVFVGNLRFDIRDDDLINHFQKIGNVDYVRLVRDRATGLGKGFGFVKFMERADAKKALELNDTDFKGRKLRVKKIDEKMKIDDGSGGGDNKQGKFARNKRVADSNDNERPQKKKFAGNNHRDTDLKDDKPQQQQKFGGGPARNRNFNDRKRPQQNKFAGSNRDADLSDEKPRLQKFAGPPSNRPNFGDRRRPQQNKFAKPNRGRGDFNRNNNNNKNSSNKRVTFKLKNTNSHKKTKPSKGNRR